jgi:hypothetical protein
MRVRIPLVGPMRAIDRNEWRGIFRDMTDDAKIAFCNGDLTLQDILGDTSELANSTKIKLAKAIKEWGICQKLAD